MEYPDKESLKSRYENYSDDEILQLLKQRKSYQKDAVDVAVEIAKDRGIINSEEDLFGAEFNGGEKSSSQLFPEPDSEEQVQKIIKSLLRVLYLVGVFPLIFCFLNLAKGELVNTFIYAGLCVFWSVSVYFMERKKKPALGFFLILLMLIGILLLITADGNMGNFTVIDWIVLAISVLLVMYCIIYIRFLLQIKFRK